MKLLNNQRNSEQSVIYMNQIKSERVCMIMNMFQSRKVKYAKSTHKENIFSAITPYHLVGYIQGIEEYLWDCNNKRKKNSLACIFARM